MTGALPPVGAPDPLGAVVVAFALLVLVAIARGDA